MTGRGIVEADSLETLNYNTQNGASSRNIPRLPLLSGSSSIGSESLDYRGYLDIEFDSSASFNNEQCQAFGSPQQPSTHLGHPQDDASTRTIRPLSLQLNKENPNEISSWICEAREEESEGLAHGGWPTNMADLTPKQSTYCCYEGGRPEVETREPSNVRTFCPPLHEDESACCKEVEKIPVPKGPSGQSYLLTEMDKRFRKEGTKKKNFNSPLPIQNVKTRHEQEKNFVQANKKNTGRSRVPEETSYCKVLSQKQAKDRSNAFPQKRHQCLPENVVRPGRQVQVEIQEEVPSTTSALQRKWLAQASAADLSSMILEQKKQLEHAFDKLMKRMDEQKKTASERAEQRTVSIKNGPNNASGTDSHKSEPKTSHRPIKAHRSYLKERRFIPPPPGTDCTLGPDFSSPSYKEQLAKRTRQAAYADAIRSLTRKGENLVKLPPLTSSAMASHRALAEYTNAQQSSIGRDECGEVPSCFMKPSPKLSPALERCGAAAGTGPNNRSGLHHHTEGNTESDQGNKPKSRRALMLEYSKRLREIANRKSKPAIPRDKPSPPEASTDESFVVLDSNILNMLKRHEEENQTTLAMVNELKSS
ncbi:hypothetical protein AAHC03_05406 [Spirometra sp. Aus1]